MWWNWWKLLFFISFYGFHLTLAIAPKGHPKETKTKSLEKSLIRMLLSRYERFGVIGRPVNDSRIQVVVSYGLQLFQILDLDENKQILRTNCWAMYTWEDSLLRWNESEYGDIKTVRIFPTQIWTPDIKLYNFADERLHEHREARVVIYSDGSTLWIPQALFKSTCEVEITYFPFDTQICMLEFGSWTYDKSQMDIVWWLPDGPGSTPMPYLDFSDYVPSNEWRTDGELERDLHHTNRTLQIRSVKKYRRRNQTIDKEFVTKEYPVLRYLVRLRRNPSFYVFMLVIPCILLSSLTLVVFWLPPESPAKMMLGMNIFVAFFVLLLLLAESTPSAVKNFPLIGVYFCLNMIMITLSTFLATLVIHLYFRGDRNGAVPAVLRRIVIDGIGRLIMVRQRIPTLDQKKPGPRRNSKPATDRPRRRTPIVSEVKSGRFLPTESNMVTSMPGEYRLNCRQCFTEKSADVFETCVDPNCSERSLPRMSFTEEVLGRYFTSNRPECPSSYDLCGQRTSVAPSVGSFNPNPPISLHSVNGDDTLPPLPAPEQDTSMGLGPGGSLEQDMREVKKYVKAFVNRQKDIQRKNLVAMEWRTLALILDRLFFFLYITTIAVAVLVCVPRSTEPEVPDAFLNSEE